ncbi:hypothetical protein OKW38_000585 [Paraburkholderia sp. MM5496-R1]
MKEGAYALASAYRGDAAQLQLFDQAILQR